MKQRLKWIVFAAMCLILRNQTIHLYRLHQEYKARYVYQRNDLLDGFIYEFNIKNTNINTQIQKITTWTNRRLKYYTPKTIPSVPN